ncbi:hypothetical protein OC834_004878 [Tilletia horrida]|nr:hypothetical protein OC834_004878 [Tilletia horrida]
MDDPHDVDVLLIASCPPHLAMAVLSRLISSSSSSSSTPAASTMRIASSSAGHALWLLFQLGIGVVLLERGCDWALDNLAQIAALACVDQTLVALLTAGGEWEELAVVIAAIKQHRSALAIGNVIGAAISNILGAFSLGLLFAPTPPAPTAAEDPNSLPAGFRYAGIDPDTGLAIVRVETRPRKGFRFDHSARVYATAQFVITSVVAPLLYFAQATADKYGPIDRLPPPPPPSLNTPNDRVRHRHRYAEWSSDALRVFAVALFILFGIYLVSIGTAIYSGWLAPPPDSSDDEGGSDTSSNSSSDIEARARRRAGVAPSQPQSFWSRWFWARHGGPDEQRLVAGQRDEPISQSASYGATSDAEGAAAAAGARAAAEANGDGDDEVSAQRVRSADDSSPITHWLFTRYPNSRLIAVLPRLLVSIFGFILLALSGSILASSGAGLAAMLGWSDTLFGLTLLSFLTTLPEKALSLVAGRKGLHGALAGSAAGSNTFLLTLCAGVALLGLADERAAGLPTAAAVGAASQVPLLKWEEILLLWLSSLALWTICLAGGRRWHGFVLLAAYVGYLVAELTIWRR